jgi:hypothetical protein
MSAYEITFFCNKIDHTWAVTPDSTGKVLPNPDQWERRSTQMADPEKAIELAELRKWDQAFKRGDKYYLL